MSDRDTNQRSVGFIGLSVLVHTGLLAALLLSPQNSKTAGEPVGRGGQEVFIDDKASSAKGSSSDAPMPAEIEKPPMPVAVAARPKIQTLPDKQRARSRLKPSPKPVPDRAVLPQKNVAQNIQTQATSPIEVPNDVSENVRDVVQDNAPSVTPSEPEFQPNSIPDATTSDRPSERQTMPENLSPIISEPVASEATLAEQPTTAPVSGVGTGPGPTSDGRAEQPSSGRGDGYGAPLGSGSIIDATARRPLAGNPKPVYPHADRLQGRQGTAVLIARVRADGLVDAVMVEKTSGSELMDRAAIDAVKKWKFVSGPEVLVRQPFHFRLAGEPEIAHAKLGQK